jgi:hypothetical protein
VAGDIWKEQLDRLLDAYRELASIAVQLRMPHRSHTGVCEHGCMRCDGQRAYDELMMRAVRSQDAQ